jgi:polysaccharide pyruvyl transferase WcaK-like protein
MKGTHPRITLLGSNTGRNVGDAAIMASILEGLSQELPDAEFYVPSHKPEFVDKNYGEQYRVKGVSIQPWTGSIRFFGLTTYSCLLKSDIALICDGIIFGRKLFNPFFNWLITLTCIIPWAKMVGCKVVCFSCGIGPFQSNISRTLARYVINNCDLVIMRENDSKKLAEEIGVTKPIHVTGDAAFINMVNDDARAQAILEEKQVDLSKPLLGININSYTDSWLSAKDRPAEQKPFAEIIAEGINTAREQLGAAFTPLIFSTHPMDNVIAYDLAKRINAKVIPNSEYLSHDMMAVMRRCQLFLGMRFHSVVLASAVEVPVIGLIYMPKVRGFMRQVDCEKYGIELDNLRSETICEKLVAGWHERHELKQKQKVVVDELKRGARNASAIVRERYFPEYNNQIKSNEAQRAVG